MPRHTDPNGVVWDIIERTSRVGTGPVISRFSAAPLRPQDKGYAGVFPFDNEEFPDNVFTTWPAGGQPFIQGEGSATAIIDAFANRNRARLAPFSDLTVTSAPDSGAIIALVVIAALVYYADKRR